MPNKDMRGIKNTKQYEALRKQGKSKSSAARITNAAAKKGRGKGK